MGARPGSNQLEAREGGVEGKVLPPHLEDSSSLPQRGRGGVGARGANLMKQYTQELEPRAPFTRLSLFTPLLRCALLGTYRLPHTRSHGQRPPE